MENGLAEDAMLTAVLPYVKTAREGVKRLGEIVAEYGSAESNGVLFADHLEAWYMEIATGHHWVAQRIPDDCVAVSRISSRFKKSILKAVPSCIQREFVNSLMNMRSMAL